MFKNEKVRTNREDSDNGIVSTIDGITKTGAAEEIVETLNWASKGKVGEVRVSCNATCTVTIYRNNAEAIGGDTIDGGLISANNPIPFVFTVPEPLAAGEWIIVTVSGLTGGETAIAMIRGWYD